MSDEQLPTLWFHPDFGAESPIWNDRREMVWLDTFPLSKELRADLERWAPQGADDGDDPQVVEEGDRLFQRTVAELQGHYVLRRGPVGGVG